ncbi:MAG: cupin domain-containing protein [Deltaproteobacteria bacterium]|nr:cupin domain-containing protein [Deltaproteobacteria bacterium]
MFRKAPWLIALILLCGAALAAPAYAQQAALKRTVLQKIDFPGKRWRTVIVLVELAPNGNVARHTHPGVEMGYVLEGETDLTIDGQPARHLKAGDSYRIPAAVPHSAKAGDTTVKIVATFVVDKHKPFSSPAP